MSITIVKAGLLDTIQDMGRHGYSHLGINPGGVMDRYAAQAANMLAGNEPGEAVIELHFPAAQILFEQNALISLTGADFGAMLNAEPVPLWHPIMVRKNTVLHFPRLHQGARCYLAVHGGFCVTRWLDSYSTNLKAGGKRLEKGDELLFKENSLYVAGLLTEGEDVKVLRWQVASAHMYEHPHEVFFIKGHEWDALTVEAQQDLLDNNFTIHPFSDRMGYQLKGVELKRTVDTEIISSGVHYGTVQLLPNGQLIVLMADHQTTGGYPRIGHVISAHLPKLSQLRPSDCIQFKLTDIGTAEAMIMAQQQELNILQRACNERLKQLYAKY